MATWRDFVKKAQLDFGWNQAAVAFSPDASSKKNLEKYYSPDSDANLAQRRADMAGLSGALKGIRDFVPGIIDNVIGNTAGIANGAWHAFTGRPFHEGFNLSKDFVKRQYSDRIRGAEMAMGGNAVRDAVNSEKSRLDTEALVNTGGDLGKLRQLAADRKALESGEGAVAGMTELALGVPAYSMLFGLGMTPGGAASKALSGVGPRVSGSAGAAADTGMFFSPSASDILQGRHEMAQVADDGLRRKYKEGWGTEEQRRQVRELYPDADSW